MMRGQSSTTQIEFGWLGNGAQTSARVRAAFAKLDRAMTSSQVARALVEAGMAQHDATSGAAALLDEDRQELQVVHSVGHPGPTVLPNLRLPVSSNFPLAEVVRTREPIWAADAAQLMDRFSEYVPQPGSMAWVMLPLMIDRVILGAVGWSFPRPGFTYEQREYLEQLAQVGGVALYRAGFFDAERRARARSEIAGSRAVQQDLLTTKISATLDALSDWSQTRTILAEVARMIIRVLGDWCAIAVHDGEGRLRIEVQVHANGGKQEALRRFGRIEAPRGRIFRQSLDSGAPIVVPDLGGEFAKHVGLSRRQVQLLHQVGIRQLLVVPLHIHGRTMGTLNIGTEDHNIGAFSAGDIAIATRIARQCAAAVEYATLHDNAERAKHAREDLVGATAHELRAPLSHIKGFVSSLRTTDAVWDVETRDDFLAEIDREADRLKGLIETLLDISRIDGGGIDRTTWRVVSPNAIVRGGTELVAASIGDHPLDIQVADDLPPVWVDAEQVERVIANLLDNAGKYSPPGEPIGIIGKSLGHFVAFRVEDRGMGIPLEHLERVFEPFFREPARGMPAKPGSGLGLSICRSIVLSQNGRIWIEPRVGGGTAFVFTLPVAPDFSRS